jgi:hypothetical protein
MSDTTDRFGISELLDERQRAALESAVIPLGHGRTRSAASLVRAWAAEITRLHAERDLGPGQDRTAWTAHDYVAALLIRGRVQRALDQLDPDVRRAATRVVARFDELLTSFTEPDEHRVVHRFAGQEAGGQWWWRRLPVSGPVRADLDRWAGRTAGP